MGDFNEISDPNLYVMALKGLKSVIKLLLSPVLTTSQTNINNNTNNTNNTNNNNININGNTILHIFGGWLFRAIKLNRHG